MGIIGRNFTILLAILVLGGVVAQADDPFHKKFVETVEREVDLSEGAIFELRNSNGAVDVDTWDKPTARIVAHKEMTVHKSSFLTRLLGLESDPVSTMEEAEAVFAEFSVNIDERDDRVEVSPVYPERKSGTRMRMNFEVTLPASTPAVFLSSNGRIVVRNLSAGVETRTSNGSIRCEDVRGGVLARTSNGSVVCENVHGGVEVQTSNGSVTVEHTGALGTNDTISCSTSNGSIRVRLAPESGFDLDMRTRNGRVTTDFDLSTAEEKSKKEIRGTVGAGGAAITLRTSNGSIALSAS